ncbi:Protein of unknown function [Gryllus bimaculatus]|nr:Protein of unknown function [Gryllus bimaculatus]
MLHDVEDQRMGGKTRRAKLGGGDACRALLSFEAPSCSDQRQRAGAARREAEERWREWADAPGNVGIGLGADPVAWYGTPPWSMRPKVPDT